MNTASKAMLASAVRLLASDAGPLMAEEIVNAIYLVGFADGALEQLGKDEPLVTNVIPKELLQ